MQEQDIYNTISDLKEKKTFGIISHWTNIINWDKNNEIIPQSSYPCQSKSGLFATDQLRNCTNQPPDTDLLADLIIDTCWFLYICEQSVWSSWTNMVHQFTHVRNEMTRNALLFIRQMAECLVLSILAISSSLGEKKQISKLRICQLQSWVYFYSCQKKIVFQFNGDSCAAG